VLGVKSAALAVPGDATSLSDVMTQALQTPEWHDRVMPKPSDFKAVFSASVMADDMLHLYQDLLGQIPDRRYS
jgi:hypothetical protein